MFGIFQHCISSPSTRKAAKNDIFDVVDVPETTRDKGQCDDEHEQGPSMVSLSISASWDSKEEEVFEEEQDQEQNWEPVVCQSDEPQQQMVDQGFKLETLNVEESDFDKLREEEDVKVIETDRNSILVSPTKVMVFQKLSLEEQGEKPKLLQVIQRDSFPQNNKKGRSRTRKHKKKKKKSTNAAQS